MCFHVNMARFRRTPFYQTPPVAASIYRVGFGKSNLKTN